MKNWILALALIFSAGATQANPSILTQVQSAVAMDLSIRGILNWKIGDSCEYNMDMGFLKGTMTMTVSKEDPQGFWLQQNIDLKFQKQMADVLVDKNNGKILKIVVNGKEQAPPKSDLEVIDSKTETITVPAGTFEVMHVTLRDKANNNAVSDVWANPALVPISGMVKTIQPNQMGKVTLELTKFHAVP